VEPPCTRISPKLVHETEMASSKPMSSSHPVNSSNPMSSSNPVRVGLTMGDPAGVGPELVLHAMEEVLQHSQHALHVFGDLEVLRQCAQVIGKPIPREVTAVNSQAYFSAGADEFREADQICFVDHEIFRDCGLQPGAISPQNGEASYQYIQSSIEAAMHERIEAVTTGPINKTALHAAGRDQYPGHTEMYAERAQIEHGRWCMMQYSKPITCTFVTVHVGLDEVARLITPERVWDTICLTHEALSKLGQKNPSIVVCGLNPHAGEGGLFGNREEEWSIIPAVVRAQEAGINVSGPVPPDTAFVPWMRAQTDAYVCMYHDQGHIPLKALAFDEAVNTTLGLKMIRTSVDHGTAYDIAWKGLVRPDSLFAAIELAKRLAVS
ncbi:MAG: 4-hydroxythreonine-4-phosphate dehydrogenase PdxA, partial [Planctomycetota bacterium]